MDCNYTQAKIKRFKLINFNHLMSIYESNFYNFNCLFSRTNQESTCILDKRKLVINDIYHDKHTRIFKLFHKFELGNQIESINMFSIIIPTYNNLKYLKVCLKSIKKNSKYNHEVIVYVNSSSDGTLEFIKNNSVKYLFNETNVGLCKAMSQTLCMK